MERNDQPQSDHAALLSSRDFFVKELDLILPEESFDGPMQMALDEALLRRVRKPTLRIYQWKAPCVSFGYFQKLAEVQKAFPNLPSVRRWTGGGMVEHGGDITFSLMIPKGDPVADMPPAQFYKELHGRVARWLSDLLFSKVSLAGEGDCRPGNACFTAPACDDLLLEGKKVLGGAQRRSSGALLYQGSLQGVKQARPTFDPVGLGEAFGGVLSEGDSLASELKAEALELRESRYCRAEWNGRR